MTKEEREVKEVEENVVSQVEGKKKDEEEEEGGEMIWRKSG